MTFEEIIGAIPQKPYFRDETADIVIYCADCREILKFIPDKSIDLMLTDPPYESQHLEYGDTDISFLDDYSCRQLIFWSARDIFPLSYSSVHIWSKIFVIKATTIKNVYSQYERIFERNGDGKWWRMFHAKKLHNQIDAQMNRDILTIHPSQKPQRIITDLILLYSDIHNLILDPFLGSGTTAYCAKKLGRKCIGIEIEERYCRIAVERLRQSIMKLEQISKLTGTKRQYTPAPSIDEHDQKLLDAERF